MLKFSNAPVYQKVTPKVYTPWFNCWVANLQDIVFKFLIAYCLFLEKYCFDCKICNKSFSEKGNLTKHLKTHEEVKSNNCTICGRSFTLKAQLVLHLKRVHLQEKSFICELCGKGFVENSRLVIHMREHSGDKPYKCSVSN